MNQYISEFKTIVTCLKVVKNLKLIHQKNSILKVWFSIETIMIDNGEFRVNLSRGIFNSLCIEKDISDQLRDLAWESIVDFKREVEREKAETGSALGSTDPIMAIQSQLYHVRQENSNFPDFSDADVREFVKEA